jgi:hypothetical protein
VLGTIGQAKEAGAHFEFHDAATHDGRSILHFRRLEFANVPIRATTMAVPLPPSVLYSLLPVGSGADTGLCIVWNPKSPGGPVLWVDADGDGKLMPAERHVITGKEMDVPVSITAHGPRGVEHFRRTIIFRRPVFGDGLSYAVRGYAAGTLNIGGKPYAALLTDGNSDGCFNTVGSDRIWIDINHDGHFDGLTEQFLLGSAITVDGQAYVIRADAIASDVRVARRTTERGRARLTLSGRQVSGVGEVSVQLVSDQGDLEMIRDLRQPVSLPVGRYRVDSVAFRLADADGTSWSYQFVGGDRHHILIEPSKESAASLLQGLVFEMTLNPANGNVSRGQVVHVTPRLRTASGLYLANCQRAAKDFAQPTECSAEIALKAQAGGPLDRAVSGFA